MIDKNLVRPVLRRLIIILAISTVFVFTLSELAHFFLKEGSDRPPEEIELVIPTGTAAKVAAGQEEPSIPDEMTFVVGDTLVVRNEDLVDHQLGPLWIPPGTSAKLLLEDVNNYAHVCSFSPSEYFGIDVRPRTTLNLRLITLAYVSPATAVFLFVYSLIVFPIKAEEPSKTEIS